MSNKPALLSTVPFSSFSQWDVKQFFFAKILSKYPVEELGKHLIHQTEKIQLSDEPTKEFTILGVSNKIGMFDSSTEKGSKIKQKYHVVKDNWLAYNPYRINVGSIGIKTPNLKGSRLLLRNIPNFSHYSSLSAMSLSSRNRSNSKAFRHILPRVAPVCEDMHYHKTGVPWQIKSTFIMQFYFLSYKFKISYIPNYLIIYFVPLPLPSIAITPFSHISFSNFVVFDFPKGIYGAISLIGFSIVLLKSL